MAEATVDRMNSVKAVEEILSGTMKSRALVLGHKLGIFRYLGEAGPKPLTDISAALNVKNEFALCKLLSVLCGVGLVFNDSEDATAPVRYRLTKAAEVALLPSSDLYYGDFVDFFADQYQLKSTTLLLGNLKDATPLQPPFTDQQWTTYMLAMGCIARLSEDAVAKAATICPSDKILDLGGGPGHYAVAFCKAFPAVHVTIYDLDAALAVAARTISSKGFGDRIALVQGSAADRHFVGGPYDVVFISHTIHLFSENDVAAMLKASYESMNPGGRVVIRDFITNRSKTSPLLGSLIALNMWIEGDAYSYDQCKRLLEEAGFGQVQLVPLCGDNAPEVVGALVIGRKP